MNTTMNTMRELTNSELDAVGGGISFGASGGGISVGGGVNLGGLLGSLQKLGSGLLGDLGAFAKSVQGTVGGFLGGLGISF